MIPCDNRQLRVQIPDDTNKNTDYITGFRITTLTHDNS